MTHWWVVRGPRGTSGRRVGVGVRVGASGSQGIIGASRSEQHESCGDREAQPKVSASRSDPAATSHTPPEGELCCWENEGFRPAGRLDAGKARK